MAASAGISNLTEIANLLGGNRTTQRVSANTAPLEQAIAQLSQQQDPTAQLTSIFQQALGAMPQLQARYSNAVGARTGSNAAVQTSLDKLLQDTVIKGQSQIAQQELARQTAAAGAAGQLAQATRNVTTQQGTNLNRAAGVLALLQGGSKLMDSPLGRQAKDKIGGFFDGLGADTGSTVDTAALPDGGMSMAPVQDLGFDNISQGLDFGSTFDFGGGVADGAIDAGNSDAWDYVLEFADGGLVGRDGNKPTVARAGGARRSASPSYTENATSRATASNSRASATPGVSEADPTGTGGRNPSGYDGKGNLSLKDAVQIGLSGLAGPLALGVTVADIGMRQAGVNQTGFGIRDALSMLNENANPVNRALALMKGAQALMGAGADQSTVDPASGETSVAYGGDMVGQSRGPGGFDGGPFGTDNSSPTGFGGGFDFGGGSVAADAGGVQAYAKGGEVKGPGTGTSDSIKARLSDGEYVIPADVVERIGVAFFDSLKDRFHEPAYVESVEQEEPGEKEDD